MSDRFPFPIHCPKCGKEHRRIEHSDLKEYQEKIHNPMGYGGPKDGIWNGLAFRWDGFVCTNESDEKGKPVSIECGEQWNLLYIFTNGFDIYEVRAVVTSL